jgi:hypothetical protein
MAREAANFYKDWMALFCFRHKISLAYRQSRLIKNSLTNHYQKVDNYAKVMRDPNVANPSGTNSLDTMQNILNQYAIDLLNLSFQKQTITTNLLNYQIRLQQIKQKAESESNLDFLDKFGELVQQKYLIQIDKDIETMQLGLKLLETNLNAIRTRIELEKSERDHIFQTLVTFIGTGTAGVAIIKDGKEVCEAIRPKESCEPSLNGNLVIPLILIVFFGYVGWLVKKAIESR